MPDSLPALLSVIATALAAIYFFRKRSWRYLQFFQQEEYTATRFLDWYWKKQAFDRKGTISVVLVFILSLLLIKSPLLLMLVSFAGAARLYWIARSEDDPRQSGKITLKVTARASRIAILNFAICLVKMIIIAALCYWFVAQWAVPLFWFLQILLVQSPPLGLIIANWLLNPYEMQSQEKFANQAREIIGKYKPKVIGITGSYGKTSTKVLLKDILGSVSPTFSTPRSINTYMGVTREIRERLKAEDKFAVIEMGAYYQGSISKMCSLTPPKAGIITSIGAMHLERFGGEEVIYQAKSELAKAIPADGILVVNGDNDYCRKVAVENAKKVTLLYGMAPEKGHLDAIMFDISASEQGSSFKIGWQGQEYEGFVALLGTAMLSNVLAAFTMSCALGVPPSVVMAALRNVKTESNRLEPVRCTISSLKPASNGSAARPGKILRLNDAYNSNPVGFAAALDVLKAMPGGKKILVTPGMIELGEKQAEENRKAASSAAAICDLVLVVGNTNEGALVEGLKQGGLPQERYRQLDSMQSAFSYLADCCQDGDIVLIENDLPDLYEGVLSF